MISAAMQCIQEKNCGVESIVVCKIKCKLENIIEHATELENIATKMNI